LNKYIGKITTKRQFNGHGKEANAPYSGTYLLYAQISFKRAI
jgi:hypothetical protein